MLNWKQYNKVKWKKQNNYWKNLGHFLWVDVDIFSCKIFYNDTVFELYRAVSQIRNAHFHYHMATLTATRRPFNVTYRKEGKHRERMWVSIPFQYWNKLHQIISLEANVYIARSTSRDMISIILQLQILSYMFDFILNLNMQPKTFLHWHQ